MKNALALLVGAVAAGAGFGALSHFTRDAADVSEDAVSPEFDLAAELQSLRDQNAELLERVRALESPLETPRIAADTSFEEFKAEIRELVANSASSTPVQPVLITDVEDALTAIRREEKQTAFAQKSDSMAFDLALAMVKAVAVLAFLLFLGQRIMRPWFQWV